MIGQVNLYPTDEISGWKVRHGRVLPYGVSLVAGGVNFSIFSSAATSCTLVLFNRQTRKMMAELPLPNSYRVGDVWSIIVFDLDPKLFEYGYKIDGPWDPSAGHRFNSSEILLDPYVQAVSGRNVWGDPPDWTEEFPFRGFVISGDFDWGDDHPLEIPLEDMIIYEMHVRAFTRHPSSGVEHPGTFTSVTEKIPHLLNLGINCVELLPIFEFDEFELSRMNPITGQLNMNFWGYSTIGFFAPKAGLANSGKTGSQAEEFKSLVRALHSAGIEVLLDIVFNHTCEGDHRGPTISFRGLDNKTYYMLTPEGYYYNFSGCGNSLNCNHPVVREMLLDCLKFWVTEYHIDGFRFDAAAILARDPLGKLLDNPPLLEAAAHDPILKKCKLIAEPWDADGLYLLGKFPNYGRFSEWNGKFRDDVRDFLRGEPAHTELLARRIAGSPDLYEGSGRSPLASINFITCHDGFTLRDLVSYNHKHNQANGEESRDGSDDNRSWNCGVEGETSNTEIKALRLRQIKNALLVLMVSRGVPMILSGDEMGRTQGGNNNTYCHDSEFNWLDWSLMERDLELFRFAQFTIALRRRHPALRMPKFPKKDKPGALGFPEISWHGALPWAPDWSSNSHLIAAVFAQTTPSGADVLYYAWNSTSTVNVLKLPLLPAPFRWRVTVNTGCTSPSDINDTDEGYEMDARASFLIGPYSSIVLCARLSRSSSLRIGGEKEIGMER